MQGPLQRWWGPSLCIARGRLSFLGFRGQLAEGFGGPETRRVALRLHRDGNLEILQGDSVWASIHQGVGMSLVVPTDPTIQSAGRFMPADFEGLLQGYPGLHVASPSYQDAQSIPDRSRNRELKQVRRPRKNEGASFFLMEFCVCGALSAD